MQRYRFNFGFTLIEMVITLTVLAILVGLAVPSFKDTLEKRRVTGAAEQLKSDLQYARSEAIRRNVNVFVSFATTGTTWCYGIDTTVCSCTTAGDCQLDGVDKVVNQSGFQGVSLSQTFSGDNMNFEPRIGSTRTNNTVGVGNGTASFSGPSSAQTLEVRVALGRVKICSPSSAYIPGYGTC